MNLGFLLPAAFAALLALAIPLLIHLARRSEQRPTDFAALRWLREQPRPRHRIRLDELPLLLMRLLLVALVTLWLAHPVLFGSADRAPWVVALPGVDIAAVRAGAPDNAELYWLAPGFPALDQSPPTATLPFASLLRQLDSDLPEGVTLRVVVPEQLQGADAERPRLSRTVDWRVVPGAMPAPKPVRAEMPSFAIRYEPGRDTGLRYFRAAALALRSSGTVEPTAQPLPVGTKNLIWLSREPLPQSVVDWVEKGGTVLLSTESDIRPTGTAAGAWRDDVGVPLVEAAARGKGRTLRFTRPLVPAAMPQLLDPDFPKRLLALFAAPAPPPSRVYARDYAPLPGGLAPAKPARDLQPWLALLIAALLLIERWFATRRTRAVAP